MPRTPFWSELTVVIDAASDTAGWQELIDVAGDQDALRTSLIERHARAALQKELTAALRQIDKGNEKVLDDKFGDLSDGIQHWWDLLRPGEPTFFSDVRPRKGARRTVDFKAGLSLHDDRSAPKVRDVIAVFSQSQLHCLGLALFIARALHEGAGFMVLDDPILASDEDYRAYFKAAVLGGADRRRRPGNCPHPGPENVEGPGAPVSAREHRHVPDGPDRSGRRHSGHQYRR